LPGGRCSGGVSRAAWGSPGTVLKLNFSLLGCSWCELAQSGGVGNIGEEQ